MPAFDCSSTTDWDFQQPRHWKLLHFQRVCTTKEHKCFKTASQQSCIVSEDYGSEIGFSTTNHKYIVRSTCIPINGLCIPSHIIFLSQIIHFLLTFHFFLTKQQRKILSNRQKSDSKCKDSWVIIIEESKEHQSSFGKGCAGRWDTLPGNNTAQCLVNSKPLHYFIMQNQ